MDRLGPSSRSTPRAVLPLAALLVVATAGLLVGFGPLASPETTTNPTPAPSPSPTATTTPPSPTPPPRSTADDVIAAHVRHLVSQTDGAGADWSVSVRGTDGQVLHDRRGDELLMPASTLKSVTAAAALHVLGPEYRFRTRAVLDGVVTDAGTAVGNLVLVGAGDPALGSPAFHTWYPARPRTHLEDLADAVVARGIRRVFGSVVGLDPLLTGPALADGWKDLYLSDFDARRITGLTIDAGIRLTRDGEVTVAEGEVGDGLVGSLSTDPRLAAARVFEALLVERGVRFEMPAQGFPTPEAAESLIVPASVPDAGEILGAVESPPLWRLLRFMVQHSDNQLADTIARVVAHEVTGDSGWEALTPAYHAVLAERGIDPDDLAIEDGSGLSRDDRVSASMLAEVQADMAGSELAAWWAAIQAVAGERGTLRTWLRGTPAVGRFRGKTGTLDDVKGIAGTVWGPQGQALHLAVLVNDAGAGRGNVRVLMDQLVLTLAAVLDGCIDLDHVAGLGAWTTGACPPAGPVAELVPALPGTEPTDPPSVAPPDPSVSPS